MTNRELQAQLLYDQAINAAHASGFVHDEALANELAARYWMQRKVAKFARLLLTDACTLLDHCAGLYPCSVVCRLRVLAVGSATQDARTSNGGAKPDTANVLKRVCSQFPEYLSVRASAKSGSVGITGSSALVHGAPFSAALPQGVS